MEKLTILLCYSLFHLTELNLVKRYEKLYDGSSRLLAKYLATLFALEEYGVLFANLFLQRASSISCSRRDFTVVLLCHFTVLGDERGGATRLTSIGLAVLMDPMSKLLHSLRTDTWSQNCATSQQPASTSCQYRTSIIGGHCAKQYRKGLGNSLHHFGNIKCKLWRRKQGLEKPKPLGFGN